MSNKYSVETIKRIYDDSEGCFIEVVPSADCPEELLVIRTIDEESKMHFGDAYLCLPKEVAMLLGEVLIELSK